MAFYLFRRYLFSSRSGSLIKIVSWVCLAGMAISLAALILIVSVMGGFGQAIKSRLLSKTAHLVIDFQDNPFLKNKPIKQKKNLFFDKTNQAFMFSDLTKEQKRGIQSSHLFETQTLILKNADGFNGVLAIGLSKDQWSAKLDQISALKKKWGAFESSSGSNSHLDDSSRQKPSPLKPYPIKEVLLSHELSLETGLSSGDELTLLPLTGLLLPPSLLPPIKRFKIKETLPFEETENAIFYYKQGQMDFGPFSKISYKAEIRLYDPEQAPFYQSLLKKYKAQTWIERNSTLFFALKLEKFMMTLFLTLAFIISCLGIASALFLLISQKGDDLAVLYAMGLSRREIVKTFTNVGLSLSLVSLAAGALIGFLATAFLKHNESINLLPKIYQDRAIPAELMPGHYLIILSLAFLLSWVSCHLPTKYLSRINPAELLKGARF